MESKKKNRKCKETVLREKEKEGGHVRAKTNEKVQGKKYKTMILNTTEERTRKTKNISARKRNEE